jgi:hypothetical protein
MFGSTPTDYMHAFLLGVLKYVVKAILAEFNNKSKAAIDRAVAGSIPTNRQFERQNYPGANFVQGVTSLTKVTDDEWAGNAMVLYLFLISGEGEKLAR